MTKYRHGIFTISLVVSILIAAFSNSNDEQGVIKMGILASYKYDPQLGVPNPPTTKAQVVNTLNWAYTPVPVSCNGLGYKFCRIGFDIETTALADALSIIGDRVLNGQSITHGMTYTVAGRSVKIFLHN